MTSERPIIFSGEMVRAILDGRKTQTRRIVKPQPPRDHSPLVVDRFCPTVIDRYGDEQPGDEVFGVTTENGEWCIRCPYGQPGDLLWVRESWCGDINARTRLYKADGQHVVKDDGDGFAVINKDGTEASPWRSSMHMPRWASRLTLRITDVRVQRLQEISEADAIAEGAESLLEPPDGGSAPHVAGFHSLWHSIYGPDSWSANPYVWALTFEVIRKNVDEVTA